MPVASDANQAVEQRRAQLSSELQRFVTIITARMRPERIIVFGSFATGRIKE